MKSLKQAMFYRNLGFSVIPVLHKSKKPLVSWKKYQTELPSVEDIKKWFTENPDTNIAVITGRVSGIIVIDVDKAESIPDWLKQINTWTVKTSRGYHFYFKINKDEYIPSVKFESIDLKAEGGYVLLPESVHPDRVIYKWIRFIKHLKEPASFDLIRSCISELLQKRQENRNGLCKLYKGVPEGERNISLTRIAGSLFADGLNEEEVYEILKTINERNIPPLPEDEVRRIVQSIAKRRKDFTRVREIITSGLMNLFLEESKKENSKYVKIMKRILAIVERLKADLPEKDSLFIEKELGKLVFPKLIDSVRFHLINSAKERSTSGEK
jgi:hypothetical protein